MGVCAPDLDCLLLTLLPPSRNAHMHVQESEDVSNSFSSNWEALRGEKGIASSHSGTNRSEPGLPWKSGPADRCHPVRCVSGLRSESALLPEIQKRKRRAWLQVEEGLCGVPRGTRRLSWHRAHRVGGAAWVPQRRGKQTLWRDTLPLFLLPEPWLCPQGPTAPVICLWIFWSL